MRGLSLPWVSAFAVLRRDTGLASPAKRTVIVAAALMVVVLAISPTAVAQVGAVGGDLAREFRPDFVRRDLQLINDRLQLESAQQEIIRTVLQDYIDTFDQAAREARANLEAIQPAYERMGQEVRQRQEQLRQELEVLVARLQEAVTADAPPEQIEAMQAQITARIESVKAEIEQLAAQADEEEQPALENLAAALRDELFRWRQRRGALREAFTTDVRLILTDEQEPRWDAALKEIQRQRLLPADDLAGESVDLSNILRQTGLESGLSDSGRTIMSEYAESLSEALVAREQALDDTTVTLWLAVRAGRPQEAADARERVVGTRMAVRDLHFQSAQRLAETLGPEQAAALDQALRQQAFAGQVSRSIGARLLEQAATAEGLENEVVESIRERQATHAQQWAALRRDLEDVIVLQEPVALVAHPAGDDGRSPSAEAQQAMINARDALSQLDLAAIEFVLGMIREERFMELPEADAAASFMAAMREREVRRQGVSPSERRAIIERLDLDGDGRLSPEELNEARGGG